MLSNQDAHHIHALLRHLRGQAALPAEQLSNHMDALEAAIATARQGALRSASSRSTQSGRKAGRPPTQWYMVSFGSQWSKSALGLAAALELLRGALASGQGNGRPPSLNSLQVSLSTKGTWWRVLATDNGDQELVVRRIPPPESGT